MEKLSKVLTGIAGEYFVAAELSRRGFMASVTLRNNESVDIHASKITNNKIFAIQVKTSQSGYHKWPLSPRAETLVMENFFYVFVSFKEPNERPEYFIVPSKVVADYVKQDHDTWLKNPGKKGQAHEDNNIRIFKDDERKYLENWGLLE